MSDFRRNDFDVTNTVQVSSTPAVSAAVQKLFAAAWPAADFAPLARSFEDFDLLFTGRMPGYHGVDTLYHDRQHSLDVTLAAARLMVGYEKTAAPTEALGADRAAVGLVTALFHDAGYIREADDTLAHNGAEFTLYHVTRGARFLTRYLPRIGMEAWTPVATRLIHFTGYEIRTSQIQLTDERDRRLGAMLGTADLIAQMADRCYLEKCRDRLYPEFVLGGIAAATGSDGVLQVRYSSGIDLLRHTPQFVRETRLRRLDGEFDRAYRYLEVLFGGQNPYIEAIDRNIGYLNRVLRGERWPMLRRKPPLFTTPASQLPQVRGLMLDRLKELWN
jgi:hypothetical protein